MWILSVRVNAELFIMMSLSLCLCRVLTQMGVRARSCTSMVTCCGLMLVLLWTCVRWLVSRVVVSWVCALPGMVCIFSSRVCASLMMMCG